MGTLQNKLYTLLGKDELKVFDAEMPRYNLTLQFLKKYSKGKRVLELGPGNMHLSILMADAGFDVTSVEIPVNVYAHKNEIYDVNINRNASYTECKMRAKEFGIDYQMFDILDTPPCLTNTSIPLFLQKSLNICICRLYFIFADLTNLLTKTVYI